MPPQVATEASRTLTDYQLANEEAKREGLLGTPRCGDRAGASTEGSNVRSASDDSARRQTLAAKRTSAEREQADLLQHLSKLLAFSRFRESVNESKRLRELGERDGSPSGARPTTQSLTGEASTELGIGDFTDVVDAELHTTQRLQRASAEHASAAAHVGLLSASLRQKEEERAKLLRWKVNRLVHPA